MAGDPQSAEYLAQVMSYQPTGSLGRLAGSTADKKAALTSDSSLLKALIDSLGSDVSAVSWSLAVVCDLLRSDSSCFGLFESAQQLGVYRQTMSLVQSPKNAFVADKAAWLLSGVIGNVPSAFSQSEVTQFLSALKGSTCTDQGKIDAIVNVLKAGEFRKLVINVPDFIDMDFNTQTAPPGLIYKKMFAVWLLTFDGFLPFDGAMIVQKLKEVLTFSRVEKVVRLSLTCLQSLVNSSNDVAAEAVEQGLLEVVQALEYEKWRDAELYDEIRNMSGVLSARTAEMSNFARYERELSAGKLKWGFIHSPKFWSENVLKFEQNDWRALKALNSCLDLQGDSTTVAVACRDLGEFVTAHPLGKKQTGALGVKDKVMKLMSSSSDKEVRREALLCCQKIMLNKWQDVESA